MESPATPQSHDNPTIPLRTSGIPVHHNIDNHIPPIPAVPRDRADRSGVDCFLGMEEASGSIPDRSITRSPQRGLPSQVKGDRFRAYSRRSSWVRIPPPASGCKCFWMVLPTAGFALHQNQYEIGSCSSLYLMVVLLLISHQRPVLVSKTYCDFPPTSSGSSAAYL